MQIKIKTVLLVVCLATILVAGCGTQTQTSGVRTQGSDAVQQPSVVSYQAPEVSAKSAAVQKQINEIAAEAKGKVGVMAVVLDGSRQDAGGSQPAADGRRDQRSVIAALNPQERFPMQSVYKLPISMAVMKQVEAGKFKLSDKIEVLKSEMIGRRAHSPIRDRHPNGTSVTIEQLMWFAIGESDGTASDVLMRIAGGPNAIQTYLTELGIKDMIVLDTEQTFSQNNTAQYRNWTTPEAAVALLRALYERRGLSEANQALLLKFMTESKPGKKRLKGMLPAGVSVAHKTGTSGTDKGVTAATNDIGIITLPNGKRVAIAVFVSESPADEATREGVIAKIALVVFQAVSSNQ